MLKKIILLVILIIPLTAVKSNGIGDWGFTPLGLPFYQYTGNLPFYAKDKTGQDSGLPSDPYFLLGNYKMSLITHTSGIYELFNAQRVWTRINASSQPNYGWNDASIVLNKKKRINLVGLNSISTDNNLVKKYFGVGFARYSYQVQKDIICNRLISVKPSKAINSGNPSFVVSVLLKNNSQTTQNLVYKECMLVNSVANALQYIPIAKRPIVYNTTTSVDEKKQIAIGKINSVPNNFLLFPSKNERYVHDVNPSSVFMYCKKNDLKESSVSVSKDTLVTNIEVKLKPNESRTFHIVIGLQELNNLSEIENQINDLFQDADLNEQSEGVFAKMWKSKLPDLSHESNPILKREMLWNSHFIEASSKYNDYYKETFIPQGSVYSYHFGDNISNRDHLQAALAACYINPELAKSSIRYVIKHSETDGEIKRGNSGYGYSAPSIFKESDEQLFFFNTISEYLLITKDYGFLNEQLTYFPAEYGKSDILLNILKKYFIYLRDEVGTGPNGLVKMLNSDWSDSFFHKYSPNVFAGSAESHLNSAMVLAILPKLEDVLKKSGNKEALSFISALEDYRLKIEMAYLKDLGDRKFSARAYLNHKLKFGIENVCIEPQGYLLQIPNLPVERKKEIYEYVKAKLLDPEKIGIRTREEPLWGGKADGEDGGIWFSLEYPVLLGVATFDKQEAQSLLLKFSFDNFARQYPEYWIGQWTAADEVNSTLYREGLYSFWVAPNETKTAFQGYCSHPHTWPLYCYFKLKEY
ncbi:hypothetical protein [Flavobacterium sp. GSB-24]|uniref:GH36-type glycosyl hydrolase domain-containing protein n=1 Tax=Flavobacterium sp. GSB-24 TaxID=2994319 RepID=UPI0024934431|nr:hypothetical protein [Flavobacterium sp. GSB-24]BDU25764.1 hypothetical protein FLGSB24_25080 [Flavobacterium sp. GSB-24]